MLFPITEEVPAIEVGAEEKAKENELVREQKDGLIMMTDDEPLITNSLGKILKSYGFDVITTVSSEDALKIFQKAFQTALSN